MSDKTADVTPGAEPAAADSDVRSDVPEALARDDTNGPDDVAKPGGGGPDLRVIVLLIVLAPFVIAMVLALVEKFKTDTSEVMVEGVALPERDMPGGDV